jgi:hypothetical protein
MLNTKTISINLKDQTLEILKHSLREHLDSAVWKGREQDLLLLDEALFLKANSIDDWFPEQIILRDNRKPRISNGNKHIYCQQDVLDTVKYIHANPGLFLQKKENSYDFKEIRTKTKLSRDQFLYFVALANEKELIRFGYKNKYYLLPQHYAQEVIKFLTGQKNITNRDNIAERGQASLAIKEIKDQFESIADEQPKEQQISNNEIPPQKEESIEEILHTEEKETIAPKKIETAKNIKEPSLKKTAPPSRTTTLIPKQRSSHLSPKAIVTPKDNFLEKFFKIMNKTGENIYNTINYYKQETALPARELAQTPQEFYNDTEFFKAACADINSIELADFHKPSSVNPNFSRLETLPRDFKNFTLPAGELAKEKIKIRQGLTNSLLPKLKRNLILVYAVENLRYKKCETMLEILLAFNEPNLAEEIFVIIKEKIKLLKIMLSEKDLSLTEKNDLTELRTELIFLQRMIIKKFNGSHTTPLLSNKGSFLDISL